jgi:hypothetical protein
MDCLVGWSLTKCIPHAVRYSAGRRMKPILRAAPRLPCNEPATGKGSAKLHAASSHAYRTSLQQVIVYRRTRTPPSSGATPTAAQPSSGGGSGATSARPASPASSCLPGAALPSRSRLVPRAARAADFFRGCLAPGLAPFARGPLPTPPCVSPAGCRRAAGGSHLARPDVRRGRCGGPSGGGLYC